MIGLPFWMLLASAHADVAATVNLQERECMPIDEEVRSHLATILERIEKRRKYFRLSQWRCEEDGIHEADWYSRHLEALEEPSFALSSSVNGYRRRVRLLVLPEHEPAYAIRVDHLPNGEIRLRFGRTDGLGGFKPGKLATSWEKRLRHSKGKAFLDYIEHSNFLGDQFNSRYPRRAADSDGSSICIAGNPGVIEQLDAAGHHTVAQTGCHANEAIYSLIAEFHDLAAIETFTAKPIN